MGVTTIILIALLLLCLVGLLVVIGFFFKTEPDSRLSNLTQTRNNIYSGAEPTAKKKSVNVSLEIEDVQKKINTRNHSSKVDSYEEKLFRAGIFSKEDRSKFRLKKQLAFIIIPPIVGGMLFTLGGLLLAILGLIFGVLVAFLYPQAALDKRIRLREEEYMFFLPLVIEQISIGVSSSLDIGPCVSYVVEMADERNSHNAVTELFVQVQKLMRAGMALEGALNEVAEVVGHNEVKNAFMFLAQCSKHGGEISKQLQELSDSVTMARQLQIEAKITALPTKATGALAVIFVGFFAMLLSGIAVRLAEGMK